MIPLESRRYECVFTRILMRSGFNIKASWKLSLQLTICSLVVMALTIYKVHRKEVNQ